MISGFVYFEEIVENIKDVTGIENLMPLYEKIRRFIFNAERDIGAGGVIVRKCKKYTLGDGNYDGCSIILPEDFIGEQSYHKINAGCLEGNIIRLYETGAETVTFNYLGYLLDSNGNPFTTRNHLDAVVFYARLRLYSSKYFLGTGNRSTYKDFQIEYNDEVLSSRGEDAFPTEEEWGEIGATLNGGTIEAMTNCGIKEITCCGDTNKECTPVNSIDQLVYYWQFDNLLDNIDFAAFINQVFLDSVLSTTIEDFEDGKTIEYSLIGRIGIAIRGIDENQYQIEDTFGQNITDIVFDKYYNEELKTHIFISKEYYSNGNIYFKLIE
jgi:hypothetical protein